VSGGISFLAFFFVSSIISKRSLIIGKKIKNETKVTTVELIIFFKQNTIEDELPDRYANDTLFRAVNDTI